MPVRISAVINTLNEEANLPFALRSLRGWVDEIVVVDMHSDDRTAEIARSYGARVVLHERTFAVDGARAFGLAQATGEWVMILDADEVVPPALGRRLRELARGGTTDVVEIPFLHYLLGAPLYHTGWGPEQERHARFFRRGAMIPTDRIHAYLQRAEGVRSVRLPMSDELAVHHLNYLDANHFLHKLNRYTDVEAAQRFALGERATPARALWGGAREFLRRFVRHRGYRDGWRGFYLSLFMGFYRVATHAKLTEMENGCGREAVGARYRAQAERLLADAPGPVAQPEAAPAPAASTVA